MRPATEPVLRKRLAALIDAQLQRERADAAYKSAAKAWFDAGAALKNARGEVAELLHRERGAVVYDNHVFRLDRGGQLVMEPLAREIQQEQEALPLGSP